MRFVNCADACVASKRNACHTNKRYTISVMMCLYGVCFSWEIILWNTWAIIAMINFHGRQHILISSGNKYCGSDRNRCKPYPAPVSFTLALLQEERYPPQRHRTESRDLFLRGAKERTYFHSTHGMETA
jgi:hypothetical protein